MLPLHSILLKRKKEVADEANKQHSIWFYVPFVS